MGTNYTEAFSVALIDAAFDKDESVRQEISQALRELGCSHPRLVLLACHSYLSKHSKLLQGHRIVILHTMEAIVKETISQLDQPLAKMIISLASEEMTKLKDVVPDWQGAASKLLVALGCRFINEVMEEILQNFQPGVLPHFFVVQTLGNLATANVYGMVPFLTAILGTMLPMLGMAKHDSMKSVFTIALGRFSESILEYLANLDKAPDPTVRKDAFSSEIYTSYEILFNVWLQHKEAKVRGQCCHSPAIMWIPNCRQYSGCGKTGDANIVLGAEKVEGEISLRCSKWTHFVEVNRESVSGARRVKWMVAQVISAMAHHDYLELDGGEAMVEFIIRQCALPCEPGTPKPRSYDPDEVTDESLRSMCDNILHLLTTTVKKMENVLWPFLLEFVIPPQYLNALAPVCRSLAYLGMKKQQHNSEGFQLNNEERDLPKPQALLTRLMVVSAFPFRGRGRGVSALRFLQVAVPLVHPQLLKVWNEELPPLIQYLEENSEDSLPQRHWEDKLLLLLSKSLEAVALGDKTWSGQLSEEMTKHLSNYGNHPSEKGFLYKCVGVVLRQTTGVNVVGKQLVEVLHSVRHTEPLEREGVAVCIGFCAKTHLDVTLAKLEDFGKSDILKKSPSLFQILKDKSDVDVEKAKSTLILCYGYLTLYAPKELILPRIEKDVIKQVLSHFNTKVLGIKVETKDLTIKLSLMKSISLIARAIYANEQNDSYNFTRKRELLTYMQDLIKLEPMDVLRTPIRQHAMITCSHLLKLDPLVDETDMFELIKTCLDSVFGLPPLGMDRCKDEACTDVKEREILYTETLSALQELLKQILVQDLTPEGLQVIFKHVEGWITSRRDWERERAMIVTSKLLLFYLERLNVRTMVSFHNLGALIGRLVPRCTDPLVTVRQNALEGLYTLICIQLRYAGFAPDHSDECLMRLKSLQSGLHQSDSKLLFHTCSEIGQVVAKSLPQDQLSSLLFMLLEALTDPHPHCSSAASVISNTLIRVRGSGLSNQIPEVLEVLHIQLQIITQEQVKASVLQTVSLLASQNLSAVISSLLSYPLPFDKPAGEMWQSLAGDVTLARRSLEFLTERLNKQLPYDEKRESMLRKSVTRFATVQPLVVTCALTKLLSTMDSAEAVSILYPSLFSSLLGRVGCTVGVRLPKDPVKERQNRLPKDLDVCSCSVEALKLLTVRGKDEELLKIMEQEKGWDLMRSPDSHHRGVAVLARAMGAHGVTHLSSIVEQLTPMLSSPYEGQRITAVAFFGELLNHRVTSDLVLTDTLLSSLLPCLVDTSSVVRMLTIRGLGNAADGVPHKIHKYSTKLLSAMIAGMDEKDDPDDLITLEAMSGLSKVLKQLDEINVQPILINIALRIRPFFEKDKDAVRAAAFTVFGNLSRFGDGQSKADFVEQIHSSLVSLLLHLNDSSEEVVKACKFTLRSVGPLMGSESVSAMLQKHLLEEANLHYGEFINDLAKLIISDFPEKVNFYIMGNVSFFKSTWPEIRGNAVMFTGFLLGNLSQEELQSISLEHVCTAIILLLRDGVPSVRIKAAEALSLLHEL
ncbi:maestro heat-like repeat-containing protein family member 1 [Rhincodon typus]|uniref:maestro heat-like repeat-containing protein family member 1 n=1 Tax=Rhincodon typus TaxID=259920 RepID=UPI00202F16C2|nr:maestro heat-like repeat-containing protein family member 1 [Rhincodon typus]